MKWRHTTHGTHYLLLIHNDIIVDHWRGNDINIGELRTGASVPVPCALSLIVTPEDVRDVVLS